jgi:YegS/Rv2252/BmrU family lipid kinase
MRAAAIFGPGGSSRDLKPFQTAPDITWQAGMPASRDDADVILLFGGDGTIHRHLRQLVPLARPVLIVPSGSGNDFARSLGLRTVHDSLTAWRTFRTSPSDVHTNVREIDLGVITSLEAADEMSVQRTAARNSPLGTRYFCCVAGIGLDAEAARRANAMPRWLRGHGGYALALAPALFQFAPVRTKIQTAAENTWIARSHQPTLLATFANTPYYGGGMKIAPRAHMNDGLLDGCIITSINLFKLLCLFPTVYFGRHPGIREVDYFQASAVRIEPETPLDVYADGEFVCRTPVEIAIERAALRVIVGT